MLLLHMQIRRYFNKICDNIEFNRHLFLSFLCFVACRVWCLPDHWIGSFCWWYFRHFLWTLHMQCVYLYDKGILYLHLFKSLNMNWIKTIVSLVYIYFVVVDPIIKIMMIEISLTVQFRHIFVLLPKPGLGFPTSYVVISLYVQLFEARGCCTFCYYWMGNYHCLIFLFIT